MRNFTFRGRRYRIEQTGQIFVESGDCYIFVGQVPDHGTWRVLIARAQRLLQHQEQEDASHE